MSPSSSKPRSNSKRAKRPVTLPQRPWRARLPGRHDDGTVEAGCPAQIQDDRSRVGQAKTAGVVQPGSGKSADHQPGRADSRQPQLAARRACAGRRCSKTSSCARRSRTSITSAFPSAWCMPGARRRTATSRSTSRCRSSPAPTSCRTRRVQTPVFVRFSTVAGSRGSADTVRDVRGFAVKFYTRAGQLRPGRQQHPGVLHPGRDEVPRPDPRASSPSRTTRCRRPRARTTPSGTSPR